MERALLPVAAVIVILLAWIAYSYLGLSNARQGASQPPCYFNGSYYIEVPMAIEGNVSVSVSANFTSPGIIVSQGLGNNSHAEWYLGRGGEINNELGFGVFSEAKGPDNTTQGWRFAKANITDGRWYNIVGVYNSSAVDLYINGELVSSASAPYPPINGSRVMMVGRRTSEFYVNGIPSFEYFTGSIKGLEIFNKALNASEVRSLVWGIVPARPVFSMCQ
jgi:hypothetical protein